MGEVSRTTVPEKPCLAVEVKKTKEMSLQDDGGRIECFTIVLGKIQPAADPGVVRAIAQLMTINPYPGQTIGQLLAGFDKAQVGDRLVFHICPSLLSDLQRWIDIPDEILLSCFRGQGIPVPAPPENPNECWKPLLRDTTPEQRFDFAEKRIAEARKADLVRRSEGELSLNRYQPGRAYGHLFFVYHPYSGFPDDQIWMTPDGRLYWFNERECNIEAFRQGVVSAGPMVAVAWGMVICAFAFAATAALGPSVVSKINDLVRSVPILTRAGYQLVVGAVLNPAQAAMDLIGWYLYNAAAINQLAYVGAELVFSIQQDAILPDIGEGIVFIVPRVSNRTIRSGRKLVVEVEEIIEGATKIRGRVKQVEIVDRRTAEALFDKVILIKRGESAKKALVQAERPLSPLAINALGNKMNKAQIEAIMHSGDDLLIGAANRFYAADGIETVLKEARSTSQNKRDGARFILKYCMEELAEKDPLTMIFEMKIDAAGVIRKVDLKIGNLRYEFKSREDIPAYLITGRLGKEKFGELQRDLIQTLGADPISAFERVRNLRWIFDSEKLPKGLTVEKVGERLGALLEKKGLFKGWPESVMQELKTYFEKEIVVLWPKIVK